MCLKELEREVEREVERERGRERERERDRQTDTDTEMDCFGHFTITQKRKRKWPQQRNWFVLFVCCGVLPVLSLAHTRMGLNLLRVLKGDSGRVLEASSRVGFDTLPDQFVNNEQKRGFRFNLACIGESSV